MELRRDVFQAIADPTRRASLTLVALHALTPGAIAGHFSAVPILFVYLSIIKKLTQELKKNYNKSTIRIGNE